MQTYIGCKGCMSPDWWMCVMSTIHLSCKMNARKEVFFLHIARDNERLVVTWNACDIIRCTLGNVITSCASKRSSGCVSHSIKIHKDFICSGIPCTRTQQYSLLQRFDSFRTMGMSLNGFWLLLSKDF